MRDGAISISSYGILQRSFRIKSIKRENGSNGYPHFLIGFFDDGILTSLISNEWGVCIFLAFIPIVWGFLLDSSRVLSYTMNKLNLNNRLGIEVR